MNFRAKNTDFALTQTQKCSFFTFTGIKALKTYRETSLQQKVSSHYNQFIRDIKETLQTMKKSQIWTQISNEHLGLIYEDSNSKVTENEAKEFLTFDVGKNKNSDENELLDDISVRQKLRMNGVENNKEKNTWSTNLTRD